PTDAPAPVGSAVGSTVESSDGAAVESSAGAALELAPGTEPTLLDTSPVIGSTTVLAEMGAADRAAAPLGVKLTIVDCFQITSQVFWLPAPSVTLILTSAFLLSLSSVPVTTTGDVVPTVKAK